MKGTTTIRTEFLSVFRLSCTVWWLLSLLPLLFCEAKFDPYQLNGGLVSAVAGRGYVVLASDTRLTNGRYEILSREHLGSRLWAAARWKGDDPFIQFDGSVKMNPVRNNNDDVLEGDRSSHMIVKRRQELSSMNGITLIGSAGCAADCEELKRQIRMEMNSHLHWHGNDATSLSPSTVATLLGQTLYSRRTFPYYSFCVLAGLEGEDSVGVVHVYDAIGSNERVAVASAGSGKEMLQPILDRLFSTSSSPSEDNNNNVLRDHGSVAASDQRFGLKLKPPVETHVECDVETTISHLVRAYQSVSEREASVGDDIVLCVLTANKKDSINNKSKICMEVLQYPLRKD